MAITAGEVAKLRELTGAAMMDAKRALEDHGGDLEKATDALRAAGAAKAAKKADRATAEGKVFTYSHGNKLAVVVEILCETDFVARNDQFNAFGADLAMHIAASAPQYVSRDQVPADVIERDVLFSIHAEFFEDLRRGDAKFLEVRERRGASRGERLEIAHDGLARRVVDGRPESARNALKNGVSECDG